MGLMRVAWLSRRTNQEDRIQIRAQIGDLEGKRCHTRALFSPACRPPAAIPGGGILRKQSRVNPAGALRCALRARRWTLDAGLQIVNDSGLFSERGGGA